MSTKKQLTDRQIEEELEDLFGFPDGMVSEDDAEVSDNESANNTELERILVGEDLLLSTTITNSSTVLPERSQSPSKLVQPSTSNESFFTPADRQDIIDTLSDFSSSSDENSDEDEIDWKKQDWEQSPPIEFFDSVPLRSSRSLPNRTRPITYFELFFDEEVVKNIVEQTNRYAASCNAQNWQELSEGEFKAFLGMIIQMGIHKLPTIEDYWSSDPILQVIEIAETMTLQRFQKILQFLHVNDNSQMPLRNSPNFDKMYKVRPLVDRLNILCQRNAVQTNSQSIDECMIKFKGRSTLKQYMPMKPIKRGFKVWCRADSTTGYLYQYEIYTGKTDTSETGLGEKVVKSLCESLLAKDYLGHVAFDNYFSSVDLLQYLYENGVYSTATIRTERVGLPLLVKKPKNTGDKEEDQRLSEVAKRESTKIKKMKKGKWKWRVRGNVGFAVWKDTKPVTVVSTAFHPNLKKTCNRTQKDGSKKSIKCPVLITEYTALMGGVDRFDQQRGQYNVGRKSRKWWKRIFYFLVDVAITNAHILHKNNTRVHNRMKQKDFRLALARELVDNTTYRKRPFKSLPNYVSKKKKVNESGERQKQKFGVPHEVRFGRLGEHWPEETDGYKRCRYCSTKVNNKRSKIQCDRCEVALCITPCFKLFHQNDQ